MHVGLNLLFLVPGETGGMEIYARELIPELVAAAPQHRFTAFVSQEAAHDGDGPWGELIGMITIPVQAQSRLQRVRGEQQLLPAVARRAGIDLMHSLASTAPAWGRFRQVVTIHDLIYRLIPESHPGFRSMGMRVLVPTAARRANRIIVDAASTVEDLRRFVGVDPSKVDVVPLGIRQSRRPRPMPEPELREWLGAAGRPLVLSVSAKRTHKNLLRLLGALKLVPPPARPLLILPGYHTAHEEQLRQRADELGIGGDVRFLGWVSGEELEGLYDASACFVFPSLAEGFGLPVLEAMSRGVPVACSARGSLLEVAGDAALFFDPGSERDIAGALERLLTDTSLAERLRQAGRDQAARFTWQATAEGTLASYVRAMGATA